MEHSQKESLVKLLAFPSKHMPKAYVNLVLSRWVRSYKRDNDFMKIIHPPSYYSAYSNYVKAVLARPHSQVCFAVLQDDTDIVLGFSVLEHKTLHYVHVPRAYRKEGIGSMLVPEDIEWLTHITRTGLKLWGTKLPNAKFDPFRQGEL